tara:strand:- start:637 stop:1068 length:432 start_codon:yes stop_codon:yes gene_type:complete
MTIADILTNKHYKSLEKNKIKKLTLMLITHNIYYFTQYFTILFILLFGFRNIPSIMILFYLFYLLGTMLHWITNNRRCYLTDVTNDLLELPRSKRIGMRDFYAIIKNIHYENDGTGTFRDNLYWSYIILTCCFCGIFLFKKSK